MQTVDGKKCDGNGRPLGEPPRTSKETDRDYLLQLCKEVMFEHGKAALRGVCHPCPREERVARRAYSILEHEHDQDAILRSAVDRWGVQAQTMMACEEAGELIQALMHLYRGRGSEQAVAEEIADLTIMMRQLRLTYGPDLVDSFIEQKMDRLQQRVQDSTRKVIG